MNTAEVIRYYTSCLTTHDPEYARKALQDAGVDTEIINALNELGNLALDGNVVCIPRPLADDNTSDVV